MPQSIECSDCKQQLQLPESMIGKRVKCPLCGSMFVAKSPDEPYQLSREEREREDDERRRREDEERRREEERRPRRDDDRRRSRDDDDDDDRRRRRDRYDDDDDYGRGGYRRPHRGGLILTLSIIGLCTFCCIVGLILGPVSWVMGATDLAEIRRGRMDRSGEGLTQAGMIIGIISTVLTVLAVGLAILSAFAGPRGRF